MRRLFYFILCVIPNITLAKSFDINDMLVRGYQNDSDHQVIREEFLETIENFPQSLSNFLPHVDVQFLKEHSKVENLDNFQDNPQINKSDATQGVFRVQQSLFNGGQDIMKLRKAHYMYFYALARYYEKEQKILLKQIEVYLKYLASVERYNAAKVNVILNEKNTRSVKAQYNLGAATRTDYSVAEANLEESIAYKAKEYANLTNIEANFLKIFGMNPKENFQIPHITKESAFNDLSSLQDKIYNSNYKVLQHKYEADIARYDKHIHKSSLLPKVHYSFIREFPIDSNSENIKRDKSNVTLNIPIFAQGGAEYAEIRKAKSKWRAATIVYKDALRSELLNCKIFWNNYNNSKLVLKAAEKALNAQQIAYDSVVQEEKLGTKTVIEVISTQNKLNEMKIKKIDAMTEMLISFYKLKALVGELTVTHMKLPVDSFNPQTEFKKVKHKIIRF